jgi:putative nucleotidyltransferase with HDIG domain
MRNEFIFVKNSLLYFYRKVPLYYYAGDGKCVLYKPAGITLKEMRIKEKLLPKKLYIKQKSKVDAIKEVQKGYNKELKDCIKQNDFNSIRSILHDIVEVTFEEPISGSLEGIRNTVNILVDEYTEDFNVLIRLLDLTVRDYTTFIHSVNVMAMALSYASYVNFSLSQKKLLGLSALLHDIGKAKINKDLLTAPRKLNEEEFMEIQKHTVIGYNILSECQFSNDKIKTTALQHHEKLDGSGYPSGRTNIDEFAQIVAIIDCYEALTNYERVYRKAMKPISALELIQSEIVDAGKFSRQIFKDFAYSLLQFYNSPKKSISFQHSA